MKELPRNDDGTLASWAWPGGYPLYYLDKGGMVLCPTCANKDVDDGQAVIDAGINYEDASLYCDDCSTRIESAYAEDKAQGEANEND